MLNILLFIFLINFYIYYNKKYKNAGVYLNSVKCNLHPRITPDNVLNYSGEISNTIASICGLNNGIFTLEPTGDKTYGCSRWQYCTSYEIIMCFSISSSVQFNLYIIDFECIYNLVKQW